MDGNYWIWYPGDFELYHAMKQNFSRVERGAGWPAFWKSEGFRNRVAFRQTYRLEKMTDFTVYSDAAGYVLVGNAEQCGKLCTDACRNEYWFCNNKLLLEYTYESLR